MTANSLPTADPLDIDDDDDMELVSTIYDATSLFSAYIDASPAAPPPLGQNEVEIGHEAMDPEAPGSDCIVQDVVEPSAIIDDRSFAASLPCIWDEAGVMYPVAIPSGHIIPRDVEPSANFPDSADMDTNDRHTEESSAAHDTLMASASSGSSTQTSPIVEDETSFLPPMTSSEIGRAHV